MSTESILHSWLMKSISYDSLLSFHLKRASTEPL